MVYFFRNILLAAGWENICLPSASAAMEDSGGKTPSGSEYGDFARVDLWPMGSITRIDVTIGICNTRCRRHSNPHQRGPILMTENAVVVGVSLVTHLLP